MGQEHSTQQSRLLYRTIQQKRENILVRKREKYDAKLQGKTLSALLECSAKPGDVRNWFRLKYDDYEHCARLLFSEFESSENDEAVLDETLFTKNEVLHGLTPMHYAILVHDRSPHALDEFLQVLDEAFQNGAIEEEYIESLWRLPAHTKSPSTRGFPPLALAIKLDKPAIVKRLITARASPNSLYFCETAIEGSPPVQVPIVGANLLSFSIACGADIARRSKTKQERATAFRTFHALLESGADASLWDVQGRRPVHVAAMLGQLDILRTLIARDGALFTKLTPARAASLFQMRENYVVVDSPGLEEFLKILGMEDVDLLGDIFEVSSSVQADDMQSRAETIECCSSTFAESGCQSAESGHGGESEATTSARANVSDEIAGREESDGVRMFSGDNDQSSSSTDDGSEAGTRPRDIAFWHPKVSASLTQHTALNNQRGSTLLHLAAEFHHIDIMRFLLSARSTTQSLGDRRCDGKTAIHIAASDSREKTNSLALLLQSDQMTSSVDSYRDFRGWTSLHEASSHGAIAGVVFLLKNGASPYQRSSAGLTPLHCAAAGRDEADESEEQLNISEAACMECIETLVAAGAEIDATTDQGATPALLAAASGRALVFQKLLELGADAGITEKNGTSPLQIALGKFSTEHFTALVKHLCQPEQIAKGRDDLDIVIVPAAGLHLLHLWGAFEDGPAALDMLLNAGASPDLVAEEGVTPLHAVVGLAHIQRRTHQTRMAKSLIEAGANIELFTDNGEQPLHIAARTGSQECVELLLHAGAKPNTRERNTGDTPLLVAARENHHKVVSSLIQGGADVNALSQQGDTQTAAHICAENYFPETLRQLIDGGADISVKRRSDGATPLHLSVQRSRRHPTTIVVKQLCEAGAPMDALDSKGYSVLHEHATASQGSAVLELLSAGCDPNQKTENGKTALMVAAEAGTSVTVHLLLQSGADVNSTDQDGRTALSLMASNTKRGRAVSEVLLACGADSAVQDSTGRTALHYACSNANGYEVAELLLHYDTSLLASQANNGDTPLALAAGCGALDTTKLLLSHGADARTGYTAACEVGHDEIAMVLLHSADVKLDDFAQVTKYTDESGSMTCVPCMEPLQLGEELRTLPCGHIYHDECILQWLGDMSQTATCPLCKAAVRPVINLL